MPQERNDGKLIITFNKVAKENVMKYLYENQKKLT